MRKQICKPLILAVSALALTALVPLTVRAQDRPDEHKDQQAQEHRDDHPAMKRDDHPAMKRDDHPAMKRDDHPAMKRDDHHDDGKADPAAQYRHDHPRASARCHDGFFTNTTDRGRACSKHGGIDVWLAL